MNIEPLNTWFLVAIYRLFRSIVLLEEMNLGQGLGFKEFLLFLVCSVILACCLRCNFLKCSYSFDFTLPSLTLTLYTVSIYKLALVAVGLIVNDF